MIWKYGGSTMYGSGERIAGKMSFLMLRSEWMKGKTRRLKGR
jgi:hypothetical protein